MAINLLSEIENMESYDLIIEPSAGNGSFSNNIPNCLALDIAPEHPSIKQQDFFSLKISNDKYKKVLTVGNPPFGKKAKLAIDFFNYAGKFSTTIAFIVPLQFRKWSVQSKLDINFKLIKDITLERNSFLANGKDYNLNCCFQIWTKETNLGDIRIKSKPPIHHEDFDIWQYNRTEEAKKFFNKQIFGWDFAVPRQGFYDYSIRIFEEKDIDPKIQWIFFKAKNKKVLDTLLNIDYTKLSQNNTAIPGFGKADVIKEYVYEKGKYCSSGDF